MTGWMVPAGTFRAHLWRLDSRGGIVASYCRKWTGRWNVEPPRDGAARCLHCEVAAVSLDGIIPAWPVAPAPASRRSNA